MELFLQELDKKFASGERLSEVTAPVLAACKMYRVHALAGLGDPFITAGEKILFGVHNTDGQLVIPKFTTNLNDLRTAAVLFGQAMWYIGGLLHAQGRAATDAITCRIVMAQTNLIWTFLEIVAHPESSFGERFFAITAALAHMVHGDHSEETISKLLQLRNLMFPNEEPFVRPSPQELVQFFPFNPATLPEMKTVDRVRLL